MKLLIIGGTAFLGRAAAVEALAPRVDRHDLQPRAVAGRTSRASRPLRGDRDDDAALGPARGPFASTSSSTPAASCPGWSAGRCGPWPTSGAHYVFVSSISATPTWPGRPTPDGLDGQPCASDAGPDDGDYGVLKAGCERAVTEVFGDRATIARAGLITRPARERRPAADLAAPDRPRRRGARAGRP